LVPKALLILTPILLRIKISRSGSFVVSDPNSLSPKKKRKHNNAWRQRQHDSKKDCLNCSHRRPHAFDPANLRTLSVHRGHSLCQSERVDPGLLLPPGSDAVFVASLTGRPNPRRYLYPRLATDRSLTSAASTDAQASTINTHAKASVPNESVDHKCDSSSDEVWTFLPLCLAGQRA
jgi:hypothetical protein